MKKDDLPAMPFYVGDWLKAPDIQCLNYDIKGIWFEMLCYMWESQERGVLLYSTEELSRLLRLPEDLLKQNLKQMEAKNIFSIRESDGAIFCRRMVRDQEIREIRTKAGSLGGRRSFASRFAKAKHQAKCENEIDNENESAVVVKKSFTIPSLEEIRAYCKERHNLVDPERFFDHYESNGWMVGKNKMKDWKAAIRGPWEKNTKGKEHERNSSADAKANRRKLLDSLGTEIIVR